MSRARWNAVDGFDPDSALIVPRSDLRKLEERISQLESVLADIRELLGALPEPVCTCVYPPDYEADACKVHGSGVPRG